MSARELAIAGLIQQVEGTYAWAIGPARRLKLWSDVPTMNRPACFIYEGGHDTYVWTDIATPKRIVEVKLFIYLNAKDPKSIGGALVNDVLDALDEAFMPTGYDKVAGRNTLNGVAYQCRIDGKILKDPGDIDGDGLVIVPIKIILP